MISLQKRFLFVHIPKTGGNSIQAVLRQYSEQEIVAHPHQDGIERFGVRDPKYKIKKHSPLRAYRDALGDEQFSKLYKFTCIRNPWDRMVSYYFTPGRQRKWNAQEFEIFILQTKPATEYLRLDMSETDPFSNVDRLIRFEKLDEDFRSLCTDLRIPPADLPKYNRSERQHYSKYYDHKLREIVRKRFAAEIAAFNYTFD
jgi:hypothetical protein